MKKDDDLPAEAFDPNAWSPTPKTPGDVFVQVICQMYGRHDEAFKAFAREIGEATDDSMVAIDELFDALREATIAARKLVRSTWRRNVAAWKMRPMLSEALYRRKSAKARRAN